MFILHAGYYQAQLLLWGEQSEAVTRSVRRGRRRQEALLPFAAGEDALYDALAGVGVQATPAARAATLWLPTIAGRACPSTPLIAELPSGGEVTFSPWQIAVVPLPFESLLTVLGASAASQLLAPGIIAGDDLRFWTTALRFAAALTARQMFVPGIVEEPGGFVARWEPIVAGDDVARAAALAAAMPSAARAFGTADVPPDTAATLLLQHALAHFVDGLLRRKAQPVKRKAVPASLHDQWLAALRAPDGRMLGDQAELGHFATEVQRWRQPLSLSLAAPYRLVFRLEEPERENGDWQVHYLLQPADDPSLLLPAGEIWKARGKQAALLTRGETAPREFLLAALGTAATLSPRIEESLHAATPDAYPLDTTGAFQFLADTAPLLEGMGYGVLLPAWWTRRGAKLRLAARAKMTGAKRKSGKGSGISLDDMVQFNWQVAIGRRRSRWPSCMRWRR